MYVHVYSIHFIQRGKHCIYYYRTTTNVAKKCPLPDESAGREVGDTDKPEVKYTPQHRHKERLEDKMIEFIDLTTKQTAAKLVPHAAPPAKDYVGKSIILSGF